MEMSSRVGAPGGSGGMEKERERERERYRSCGVVVTVVCRKALPPPQKTLGHTVCAHSVYTVRLDWLVIEKLWLD